MIIRDDVTEILKNKYNSVRKLELLRDDENIRVMVEKNGDVCFLGAYMKNAAWKNIFTGDVTDNVMKADYYAYDNYKNVKYANYYVCDEAVDEDMVICLKPDKNINGIDMYIDVINKEFTNVLGNSLKGNGRLEPVFDKLKTIRCIKLAMFNILFKRNTFSIREYRDGFTDTEVKASVILNEDENIITYNCKTKLVICNDYKYYDKSNSDDVLLCTCYSENKSEKADISGIVELLKPRGYIYVKPFVVEKDIKSAKIMCIANRRLALEYYDDSDDKWKSFESLDNYEAGKELRLRVLVEHGDRIKEIVIAG